jgi:hypothetical protein
VGGFGFSCGWRDREEESWKLEPGWKVGDGRRGAAEERNVWNGMEWNGRMSASETLLEANDESEDGWPRGCRCEAKAEACAACVPRWSLAAVRALPRVARYGALRPTE